MKICPICKKQYEATINICPQDNEILEEDLTALIGKTLDGQYLIEKLLGQGGMGAVFRARHTLLGDQVAIKIMPGNISKNADYQRRFLREGKTARQFSHPNVVTVHDLRTTQDGMFYMVLEYVEGHTLSEELKKLRRFSPKEAVNILSPIGEALTMAHSLGIIHRDLKPDNIMIGKGKDGSKVIKLLDLGIAKVKSVDATALTMTGQMLGTPHYMSPEQWNGDEIDGRADIYSLGIMMYELVAGVRPFSGKTIQKLAYEHSVSTPPLLSKVVSRVSEEFSKVVEQSIEKDPDKRPKNCQELFEQLKEALKYETLSDEGLEQCPTLVNSESMGTFSGSSQNKTKQENQATLMANTENTQSESKLVVEKASINATTLVSEIETTNANNKTQFNQTQEVENSLSLSNESKTFLNTADNLSQLNVRQSDNQALNSKNDSQNIQNKTKEVSEKDSKAFTSNERENTKNTKSFFNEENKDSEIKSENVLPVKKSSAMPLTIISLVVVLLSGGVYVWKAKETTTSTPTPSLSPSINSTEQVEVLRYWLEFIPYSDKKIGKEPSIKKADVNLISSKHYLKFHFVANKPGYLYILGLGKNNLLVNFLSNNPTEEDTGLKSNKINLGEKITFPSGLASNGAERIIDLGGEVGKETYSVIFSSTPITNLSFFNSKPGYELTAKEIAEWEQLRATAGLAKVTFESGKEEGMSLAKVTTSNIKPEQPIIFNIIFEHN